ncbi:MAG: hypothetical protein WCD80_12310, partial [Desulfobaccales bacterium]
MRTQACLPSNISSGFRSFFNSSLLISILICSIIIVIVWKDIYLHQIDNLFYINLAKGEPVIAPFSGRIFYPNVVYLIHKFSGLTLDHAFALSNSIALLVFIFSITALIKSITSNVAITIPIIFTPFLIFSFRNIYYPDLFSAALTGLFFLLLYRSLFWLSLFLLLLVYLTRENALLLCLAMVGVAFYKSKIRLALAAMVVMIMAIFFTSIAARRGLPLPYQINTLLYMVFKVGKNFLYNVFGILIWTNVYPDAGHPYLTLSLPTWLPLGKLHSIGITPVQPLRPLNTITLLLTTFGVTPPLLLIALLKHGKRIFSEGPFWLLVAIIYG